MTQIGRGCAAVILALSFAAAGLDACFCDWLARGGHSCCHEAQVDGVSRQAQLDEPPCCCAVEAASASAPAPTLSQREASTPEAAPRATFAFTDGGRVRLAAASSGLRPSPGPDPTPPPGLLFRRFVVLVI